LAGAPRQITGGAMRYLASGAPTTKLRHWLYDGNLKEDGPIVSAAKM